jgi:hypothetical protein
MKIYTDNWSYHRPFDYTDRQREHYAGMSVNEPDGKAVEYAKNNPMVKTEYY